MKQPITNEVLVTTYHDNDWHKGEVKSLLAIQFTAEFETKRGMRYGFYFYKDRNITWKNPEEVSEMATAKKKVNTVTPISKPRFKAAPGALKKAVDKSNKNTQVKGLDLDRVIIDNKEKMARSKENAERHEELSGMTVRDALATRRVEAKDIRYDLDKGFMKYK